MYSDNPDLEHALNLLFVKGSEGDGRLHLTESETHALCEYVRRLQKPQSVNAVIQIDGKTLAKVVMAELPGVIRPASDTRNY